MEELKAFFLALAWVLSMSLPFLYLIKRDRELYRHALVQEAEAYLAVWQIAINRHEPVDCDIREIARSCMTEMREIYRRKPKLMSDFPRLSRDYSHLLQHS